VASDGQPGRPRLDPVPRPDGLDELAERRSTEQAPARPELTQGRPNQALAPTRDHAHLLGFVPVHGEGSAPPTHGDPPLIEVDAEPSELVEQAR
jgi:hypothetical protein